MPKGKTNSLKKVSSSDREAVLQAMKMVKVGKVGSSPEKSAIDPRFRSKKLCTFLEYARTVHSFRQVLSDIKRAHAEAQVEILTELLERGFSPNGVQQALDEARTLVESLYESHPHRPPKPKFVMQFRKVIIASPPTPESP